jgi:hypothetical protein
VESRFKVSQFKVFPHLVFIFCSPGKSPIYAMHKLPRFSVSWFRVFPAFSGWKFSRYMKSVPQFSVYAKPEGHKLPTSGLCMLLFAQGQLPCHWLANNTRGCSLTLSNKREGATLRHVYCILLEAVLTHVRCVLFATYVYKSVFKIGIFAFNSIKNTYISCLFMHVHNFFFFFYIFPLHPSDLFNLVICVSVILWGYSN